MTLSNIASITLAVLFLSSTMLSIGYQQQQAIAKHHSHNNDNSHVSANDVKNALRQLREADKQREIRSQPVTLPNGSRVAFSQLPLSVQESLLHNVTK